MTQREIKFRAYNKNLKRMEEIDGINLVLADGKVFEHFYRGDLEDVNENFILMQFTGLKDKNGKEIYESDVVQSGDNRGLIKDIWTFEWIVSGGATKEDLLDPEHPLMQMENIDKAEVIGNIYENPELLQNK